MNHLGGKLPPPRRFMTDLCRFFSPGRPFLCVEPNRAAGRIFSPGPRNFSAPTPSNGVNPVKKNLLNPSAQSKEFEHMKRRTYALLLALALSASLLTSCGGSGEGSSTHQPPSRYSGSILRASSQRRNPSSASPNRTASMCSVWV